MSLSVTTFQYELLITRDGTCCSQLSKEELEQMLLTSMQEIANFREVRECNFLGTNSLNKRRSELDRYAFASPKSWVALFYDRMDSIKKVIV